MELISPECEASFEFIKRVLSFSGWEEADIKRTLDRLRQDKEFIEFSQDNEGEL